MEKNKYLKYCRYYKGEDKPPTEMQYKDFWILERNYITSYDITKVDRKNLDFLAMCFEKFPETKEFINSFEDEFVRKMLATFVIYTLSHVPLLNADFIFDYGK